MEKRSAVHAVVAESLVFESSFGGTEGAAAGSSQEVAKPAQSIPAWSAAALACRDHQDQRPERRRRIRVTRAGQPPPEKCDAKACANPPNPPRVTLARSRIRTR